MSAQLNAKQYTAIADPTGSNQRSAFARPWFAIAVVGLLTVTFLALLSFPIKRIATNAQVNYNEG